MGINKFINGWKSGLPETPCGYGSKISATAAQRAWIPQVIEKYNIKTIADIGAGDLNWIKETDLKGAEYQPYDLVPRVARVTKLDIVNHPAPCVDLLMCLWVLNHLKHDEMRSAIRNLRDSNSQYLLISDRPEWHSNQPKEMLMPFVEMLVTNKEKNERLILVDLNAVN